MHTTSPDFDLVEMMAFTAEAGIALLEPHLARIGASAAELGFAFDRHAARNTIQALCFDAEGAAVVRLLLARSGAQSLEIAPPPMPWPDPVRCVALPLPEDADDPRMSHSTTDRALLDAGACAARGSGADEALLVRADGRVTQGCCTTVFVKRDGVWLTPPAHLGLVPGVLRASLLAAGEAREAELTLADLAGGFAVGNAVRGLMRAEFAS